MPNLNLYPKTYDVLTIDLILQVFRIDIKLKRTIFHTINMMKQSFI